MLEEEKPGVEMSPYNLEISNAVSENSVAASQWLYQKVLEQAVSTSKHQADYYETAVELPIPLRFNDGNLISVIVYSILFVFSAFGNMTVLVKIMRIRRSKGRLSCINLLLLHLAVADLLVTFLMMLPQIAWNLTVSWVAGDAVCRIMSFFNVFGLYLSGFLLVAISLYRCSLVLRPLDMHGADQRGRIMLIAAWICSILCSTPQVFLYHVERSPEFDQCVTFRSFPTSEVRLLYKVFAFVFLFAVPLGAIVTCNLRILCRIVAVNKEGTSITDNLRDCNTNVFGRAKMNSLKLTIISVATFIICWTPYNIIYLWSMIDPDSAQQLDQRVQHGLFIFACTNSCFNPLVYGYFHLRKRNEVKFRHPQAFRPQEQTQSYKFWVRWRPAKDLEGGNSAAASSVGTFVEGNRSRPRPSEPTVVEAASTLNTSGGQSKGNPSVVIILERHAFDQTSGSVKFHVGKGYLSETNERGAPTTPKLR